MSDHKILLGIPAIWNFFEVGHGKVPCDGIGGTSKRIADLAIKQGKLVVKEALDYFEKISELKGVQNTNLLHRMKLVR